MWLQEQEERLLEVLISAQSLFAIVKDVSLLEVSCFECHKLAREETKVVKLMALALAYKYVVQPKFPRISSKTDDRTCRSCGYSLGFFRAPFCISSIF